MVIEEDREPASGDNKDFHPAQNYHRKRRIALYLIITGAAAFVTYEIWQEMSESPTKFDH